jgi:hypothetical protein
MIVGSGRMAQRFLTADVSINGGRSLNGMRYFRDRMYWSHNMTYRDWQPKRSNEQVRAFLVDNKRYSKSDRENMDKAIAVAKTEGMTIKKVRVPSEFESWYCSKTEETWLWQLHYSHSPAL